MKKLSLLIPLLSLLMCGCTPVDSKGSNTTEGGNSSTQETTGGNTEEEHTGGNSEQKDEDDEYVISNTAISLAKLQQLKLYVFHNGKVMDNKDILWRNGDSNIAFITSDGTVTGLNPGSTKVEAWIKSDLSLFCDVTVTDTTDTPPVTPPGPGPDPIEDTDSEIVKFFKKNADSVSEDGKSYTFVSAKSKYDYATGQTYIWNMYFDYNVETNRCFIMSQMNGTYSNGINYDFYGYNYFDWGDYKNGLFGGGYEQETAKGSNQYASFEILFTNDSIVFHVDRELLRGYELSYYVDHNDFSSNIGSDDVIATFARVQECCSYAKDVFTKFNVNLSLY